MNDKPRLTSSMTLPTDIDPNKSPLDQQANASASSADIVDTSAPVLTTHTPETADKVALTADRVHEWLLAHPDFLLAHDDVLVNLSLPDASGVAVSLHHRQLRVLRDTNAELEHKLRRIVENAKYAQSVNQRLFSLAEALLHAPGSDWVERVREHFELERAGVWLRDARGDSTFAMLDAWLGKAQARCDEAPERVWLQEVFGHAAVDLGSVAGVAIRHEDECAAILVLGATDAARFQSNMAVEALEQLGSLLAALLPA